MKKKVLLFAICLLMAHLGVNAQTKKTIENVTAGQLSTLITNDEKFTITDLTITGELNGTDFRLLRAMAGNDYTGHPTEGKLEKLDLSGVTIVAGGSYAEFEDNMYRYDNNGTMGSAWTSEFQANKLPSCLFIGCSKLQEIKLPSSIEAIETAAFNHTGLTSFIVPKSTEFLGTFFLSLCDNLISLDVESGNTAYWAEDNAIIETSTKRLVAACKNTTIPNTVEIIGQDAFCNTGETIELPQSLIKVENRALYSASLKSINIPASVTEIEGGASASCSNLIEITVDAGSSTYESPKGSNAIIEKASKTLVAGCQTTVIPSDVTAIGARAFENIYSITSITLPASITSIGRYAFSSCGRLSINLPNSITSIDECAFAFNSNLTVTVESTTPLSINENVFQGLSNSTLRVPAGSKSAYAAATGWKKFGTILEGNEGSTFTAKTTEGWDMVFTILDESAKTCQVGYLDGSFDKTAVDKNTVNGAVTIPNTANGYTVVKIGKCAFQGVNGMKTVTIPNTVTSIDELAFQGCGLTSFVLPKNVTYVGRYALSPLRNVTSVKVEEGNTKYDSRDNCNAIIETATNILQFGYGISTIPASVKELGVDAFFNLYDCTLTIPSTITKINEYAFSGCQYLNLQVAHTDPLEINGNVFQGLSNSTLRVPAGSKSAYAAATGWKNFGTILEGNEGSTFTAKTTEGIDMVFTILDESAKTCQVGYLDGSFDKTAVDKNTVNGAVTIPNTANGYKVVKIGKWALNNVDGMTSVTIPESVTSIDDYAFHSCDGLESFELPASVTSLGTGALSAFWNVTSLTVAADNPNYDSRDNCNAIIEKATNKIVAGCQTTIIPANVTGIGTLAFDLSRGSIFIPSTITTIEERAFYCGNVTIQVERTTPLVINGNVFQGLGNSTLRVPAGSKSAYAAATGWKNFGTILEGNEGSTFTAKTTEGIDMVFTILDESAKTCQVGYLDGSFDKTAVDKNTVNGAVTIPNTANGYTVVKIGRYALQGVNGMKTVTIPNTVTSIKQGAFNSSSIKNIAIPASVSLIEDEAFVSCYNLATITVDASNETYESPEGSNAIIEKSTKTLIAGCKSTIIPSGVKVIGARVFNSCNSMASITIPASIESIGDYAFGYCHNLTSVTVEAVEPLAINETVFSGTNTNATLYVPVGSKTAYQAANYWKEFKEIVEAGASSGNIVFASDKVKAACVAKWDTDKDGELSYAEAAAVTSLVDPKDFEDPFALLTDVESDFTFDEFQYFTGVTSLTNYDFDEFEHLTSIVLPNSIQSIEGGAFYDCKLTSIHIPASVTDISDTYINESVIEVLYTPAFNSSFLQTITVDPGNTRYSSPTGSNVIIDKTSNTLIMGCRNTDFSKIPNTVTTIAMRAFEGVEFANPAVNLPKSVEAIKAYAFNYSNIISINLGELTQLTEIGLTAFKDCDGLTEVTLPASITTMERAIFAGCDNIIKVVSNRKEPLANNNNNFDPDHIIGIYNNAVLYVPSGKVEAYTNAGWEEPFEDDLKSFRVITDGDHTDPEAIEGLAYNGSDQKLILPGTYRTGMMEYSLDGSTYSTSVPTGKEAGEYTVYYRKVGESVASTLQVTIALSGNIVFANDKVKAACVAKWDTNGDGELSYEEAAAVTSLVDKNDADDPFAQLWELWTENSEFSFDEFQYFTGVTSLAGHEFECTNLTSIILPNSITSIGDGTFVLCKKLTSIHIPASVTYIHMGGKMGDKEELPAPAFNPEYLQTITVDPENTKYASPAGSNVIIDTETNTLILGCGNTDFTKIPNTVTTIGRDAFSGVTFANPIVSLPTSVTKIKRDAFRHSNITSINLGELSNLTTIGTQAFSYCTGLTEVTLPASIRPWRLNKDDDDKEGIETSVFANCYNIVKVVSNIEEPFNNDNHDNSLLYYYIFAIENDAVLYVPEGKVQAYIDKGWKEIDGDVQSFRVITDGDYTPPIAREGLVYGGSDIWMDPNKEGQRLIYPGAYRDGMMEYSLDGTNYSTSVPTGKEAGEYTVYYRKVGLSDASILKVTIAAPKTISVFSGSNLWAGYVATEDLALPTGLEAYVITNLGATTATASSLNYIPQGVPVLLKRNNASVNDYEISTGSGTAPTVNLLKTYDSDKSVSNREGFILYNDEFVLVNEGTLPAGRVFLPANGSGRALTRTIVFDRDDIVDFGDSQENNDDSNQWYDIQGRKLERKPTKKGIYILDGRKVVIK